MDSASSNSQSDGSQAVISAEQEVFELGVHNNLEVPEPGKKKKVRSSSLSRFFLKGKQRRFEYAPVIQGEINITKPTHFMSAFLKLILLVLQNYPWNITLLFRFLMKSEGHLMHMHKSSISMWIHSTLFEHHIQSCGFAFFTFIN